MKDTLLVELLTEELPPRSLLALARAFDAALREGLAAQRLIDAPQPAPGPTLATPRRLAALVEGVRERAADLETEVTGPPVSAPAQAVAGFARKHGLDVARLEQRETPKGKVFAARVKSTGASLDSALGPIVAEAIRKLPVAKLMRWGSGEAQFVRPVHRLVMMRGARVVPGRVLDVDSGDRTCGHRFLATGDIKLREAGEYERRLADEGRVIVAYEARRTEIERALREAATRAHAQLGEHETLLDEVTALVEAPAVYLGRFDAGFLAVPHECLILTMRQHQKYFPLFDGRGALKNEFLIVSNMPVDDPSAIIAGNERVVRPRLQDARFFYEQDRKLRLEARVPELARVVYHGKLGSQLERVERIQLLAGRIARALGADVALAERAAWLSKADLLTGMVGEFPELQGIMGRYYALHDGEPGEVADAIEAHYRPRFSGDRLPEHAIACTLALADKLDALTGLFAIGQAPTGEKDPFGLRRAGLGVVRILAERALPLRLGEFVRERALEAFLYERARGYFQEKGYSASEVDAVLALRPERLDLVPRQLEAVHAFAALPEADSLATANKRIANILRQAAAGSEGFDKALLLLPEERALDAAFERLKPELEASFGRLDFTSALRALASLKGPVDLFFERVMVMDPDARVRANRIGFLGTLHAAMNRVADLSRLAK